MFIVSVCWEGLREVGQGFRGLVGLMPFGIRRGFHKERHLGVSCSKGNNLGETLFKCNLTSPVLALNLEKFGVYVKREQSDGALIRTVSFK